MGLPGRADGSIEDAGVTDTSAPGTRCSPDTPFGTPVLVDAVNSASDDYGAHLTADERDIYFARRIADAGLDLFQAHRDAVSANFAPATPFTLLNTAADDNYPTVTGDGLTLLFERQQGSGFYRILATQRATTLEPFGAPRQLDELLTDGGAYTIGQPSLLLDGSELYFIAFQAGYDIYRSARTADGGFDTPSVVSEITTSSAELSPTPSADGLVLYFGSNRAGGTNKPYVATRASKGEPFGMPRLVTELSSSDPSIADIPSWISPDLCRLYMVSTRTEPEHHAHIFVATRQPQ